MIANKKRLVVFCEMKKGTAIPWIHYLWDYDSDTNYRNYSRSDFSYDILRGNPDNVLFTMNHFIQVEGLGTGNEDSAAAVNAYDYLFNRAYQCYVQTGKIPNLIAVDFYDKGEPVRVVNDLNSMKLGVAENKENTLFLFPNPGNGIFYTHLKKDSFYTADFFNCNGQNTFHCSLVPGIEMRRIDASGLTKGFYLCRIANDYESYLAKVIIN